MNLLGQREQHSPYKTQHNVSYSDYRQRCRQLQSRRQPPVMPPVSKVQPPAMPPVCRVQAYNHPPKILQKNLPVTRKIEFMRRNSHHLTGFPQKSSRGFDPKGNADLDVELSMSDLKPELQVRRSTLKKKRTSKLLTSPWREIGHATSRFDNDSKFGGSIDGYTARNDSVETAEDRTENASQNYCNFVNFSALNQATLNGYKGDLRENLPFEFPKKLKNTIQTTCAPVHCNS